MLGAFGVFIVGVLVSFPLLLALISRVNAKAPRRVNSGLKAGPTKDPCHGFRQSLKREAYDRASRLAGNLHRALSDDDPTRARLAGRAFGDCAALVSELFSADTSTAFAVYASRRGD